MNIAIIITSWKSRPTSALVLTLVSWLIDIDQVPVTELHVVCMQNGAGPVTAISGYDIAEQEKSLAKAPEKLCQAEQKILG